MSTYRIEVDRSACSGFGACLPHARGLFVLDASSIATVTAAESDDPDVLAAADACPMGAISVVDCATGERLR